MSQAADADSANANLRRTALWGTQWGQLDGLAGFSFGRRSTGRGAPAPQPNQLLGLRAHRVIWCIRAR